MRFVVHVEHRHGVVKDSGDFQGRVLPRVGNASGLHQSAQPAIDRIERLVQVNDAERVVTVRPPRRRSPVLSYGPESGKGAGLNSPAYSRFTTASRPWA